MDKSFDFSEQDRRHVSVLDRGRLHRVIGAPQLYAIGYGDVGSSIFYALGVTTLYALGAAPLALALAGVVFICTVLTYTELATAMPEAGGSASFARHAFNNLVAFIAGWALLLDYIVTIAISAYTIGPYLGYFWPALKTVTGNVPFAIMVIGVLLLINLIGIKESTRVALLLCIFNNVTQLLIIGIAVVTVLNLPYLIEHMRIGVPNVDWSPTPHQFMKGVGMAMVAYIGIESISQLAGEARHPRQSIPRAMMWTMGTLLLFYFLISTVALSAIHPVELSTTYLEDPLAGIVAKLPTDTPLLGSWVVLLRPWVAILGATLLFVAANAGLIGASRLTFAMAEHFELPRLFYRVHPKYKTPYVSLIMFAILAALVIFVAKRLTFIAELYNFGAMLAFSLAHLSLLGLRIRKPDMRRPFRVGWNIPCGRFELPLPALLGFVCTVAVWIDVIITKPAGRNLGVIWMGLGLMLYLAYRRQQYLPAATRVEVEKLTVPEHHEIRFKKILVPVRGASVESVQFAAKLAKDYGAELTALHVIEMPPAFPLDTFFPEKLSAADGVLERAQAVGREYDVPMETHVLQSRSAGLTIVEEASKGKYDLIVMGAAPMGTSSTTILAGAASRPLLGARLGSTVESVIRNAPCRVWICTGREKSSRTTQA